MLDRQRASSSVLSLLTLVLAVTAFCAPAGAQTTQPSLDAPSPVKVVAPEAGPAQLPAAAASIQPEPAKTEAAKTEAAAPATKTESPASPTTAEQPPSSAQPSAARPLAVETRAAEPPAPAVQPAQPGAATCQNTLHADVVALDQPIMLNRLGAALPQGMIFALRQDVVSNDGGNTLKPGAVMLRSDKRPRPIVLRVNQGDCLQIKFTNLLSPEAASLQPATRESSLHLNGIDLKMSASQDDGSFVGANQTSLAAAQVPSGQTKNYQLYADQLGTFLLYSTGATFGSVAPGDAGQVSAGMFGAVNVEPATSEYYRSQVTNEDLSLATKKKSDGTTYIDYNAHYPTEGKYDPKRPNRSCGAPILKMVDVRRMSCDGTGKCVCKTDANSLQLYSSDLTAVITGPNAGNFASTKPEPPVFAPVSASPNRTEPWREFTIIYHEVATAVQAFNEFNPLPSVTASLTKALTTTGTTPITVGSTTGFPQSGFISVTNSKNSTTEYIQYDGKSATQLGTAKVVRGVNGPPAAAPADDTTSITLYQPQDLSNVLTAGKDNFAVNYGTGGIGAEILANRFKVGPMANCVECKFEEFFLSSWAVSDPAMVVDIPANSTDYTRDRPNVASTLTKNLEQNTPPNSTPLPPTPANPSTNPPSPANPTNDPNLCSIPGYDRPCLKATKAFYPDDPSNVYHSYLDDHVKFQILNAGASISHVHHQHAHQWMHTPNDTNSSYLDSQFISPGAAYTLEIDYNGSGNRNKTVGDSIFHCHFYPHFAAGMWGLWRVHDVFEEGTKFEADGITPATGYNRVLPDGEIARGTPIPAVVPIPTLAMAPTPAKVQVCAASTGWQVGNTVGNVCPTVADSARVGFAAMVNQEDIGRGMNPGYPFFIPGIAGHRAPHPPFDFAYEMTGGQKVYLDGGLPRHVVRAGTVEVERHNQWDFTKDTGTLNALQLPEDGTPVEQVAMAFMGQRVHPSVKPSGEPANFIANGLPRKPGAACPGEPDGKCKAENKYGSQLGAPFADPGVVDGANPTVVVPVGRIRRYKAAVIQKDVVFSKEGWHYPQQRFETLWDDVALTIANQKPPEPLFFRANSREDVIEFWHTNLVPDYYELDDFQVRTPTDILGQHIHLVKFDVLSSDGAANGFNYEDGTLSPDDVRQRIKAVNAIGGLFSPDGRTQTRRTPAPAPARLGKAPFGQDWSGAQTTVQRWYADPLIGCPNAYEGCAGQQDADRTMRTVFTHDHFGPSTHQQAGLYSGLLIEPEGSRWINPENKETMGQRDDGGPTGWQANIVTANQADSYREFALEFQDLTLAYDRTSRASPLPYKHGQSPVLIQPNTPLWGWAGCVRQTDGSFTNHSIGGGGCAPDNPTTVNPSLISATQGVGTASVNYRTEPLKNRVGTASSNTDPNNIPPAADLSYAFSSIKRLDSAFNTQPALGARINQPNPNDPRNTFVFPGGFAGATGYDPYTPLLRAYQNDRVQVRVLVGAHLFQHSFTMQGLKWLFEPSSTTSGWRDNHTMGISEHFEMLFTVPSSLPANMKGYFQAPPPKVQIPQGTAFADYLYMPGAGVKDLRNGLWGMLRAYNTGGDTKKVLSDLLPLPNNDPRNAGQVPAAPTADMTCPVSAPTRTYNVAAITSVSGTGSSATPVNLVYNNRDPQNQVTNGNSMVYVMADATGKPLSPLPPTQPVVLRAAAGECVLVKLFNQINTAVPDIVSAEGGFGNPSANVGLHAQLVSADVTQSNGNNIGFNPEQTACPPGSKNCPSTKTYRWYTGNLRTNSDGTVVRRPVEFGALNLMASDPINQASFSLIGALVVEPRGAQWCSAGSPQTCSGAAPGNVVADVAVDVTYPESDPPGMAVVSRKFREFVAIMQNNLGTPNGGVSASVNFGSEPMTARFTSEESNNWSGTDLSASFSNANAVVAAGTSPPNSQCPGDPYTPVFAANAGTPVRFRMLHPDGNGGFPDSVWTIHGHAWQESAFVDDCLDPTKPCPNAKFTASARLGFNPYSQSMGSRDGFGPGNHFDILVPSAGGNFKAPGDYLYRTYPADDFTNGNWGVFRVLPADGRFTCPTPTPGPSRSRAPAAEAALRARVPAASPAAAKSDRTAGGPAAANRPNPSHNGFERFFERKRVQKGGKP